MTLGGEPIDEDRVREWVYYQKPMQPSSVCKSLYVCLLYPECEPFDDAECLISPDCLLYTDCLLDAECEPFDDSECLISPKCHLYPKREPFDDEQCKFH
jgi:hypothetical protein